MLGAGEELEPYSRFKRVDVAPDGRLRQPQNPRRSRQRALVQDRQEGPVEIPARFGLVHTFMYRHPTDVKQFRFALRIGDGHVHRPDSGEFLMTTDQDRPRPRRYRRHRRRGGAAAENPWLDGAGAAPRRRRNGRPHPGFTWIQGDAMRAGDVIARRPWRRSDRPRGQPARLPRLGQAGAADAGQHDRGGAGGRRAHSLARHGLQLRPRRVSRSWNEDLRPEPHHPQGRHPGRDGTPAPRRRHDRHPCPDRPRRRLLRTERRQQLVHPRSRQTRPPRRRDRLSGRAGHRPPVGLSPRRRGNHGPARGDR